MVKKFFKIKSIFQKNNFKINFKIIFTYDKLIFNSHKIYSIQLNSQLILITKTKNWLIEMSNFSFLKQKLKN
jgi:hypothetical protein